jgi:hypothetical protein
MTIIHLHTRKTNEDLETYEKEKQKSLEELNKYLDQGKDVFAFIFMNGCGPCDSTKVGWHKLKDSSSATDPNVCVVDIEQSLFDEVKNPKFKEAPSAFPTLRHIRGEKMEEYEDVDGIVKDRSLKSFVDWLDKSKSKSNQSGGRKRKRTHKKRFRTNSKKNKKRRKISRRK